MKVDVLTDPSDFLREMEITADLPILDKKGNSVIVEKLVPGTEIELSCQKVNYKETLKQITVLTKWTGGKAKIDGLIEKFDPTSGIAVVDGEKVKLGNGVSIKGTGKYKKQKYKSFGDITLGNFIKLDGIRSPNGLIIAENASVKENIFTKSDGDLRASLAEEFSADGLETVAVPSEYQKYTNHLERGYIQFGDAQFKLVEDLKVQSYVNYVGNKLVPAWQKNIPYDAPERLRFRFYVIENPTLNAFALPNGMIFVHTGLMEVLDNEAQLAAILGHEIAHATHEHGRERYDKERKRALAMKAAKIVFRGLEMGDIYAADLLLSSEVGYQGVKVVAGLARQISALPPESRAAIGGLTAGLSGLASNIHSQGNENQSDRVGLFYMEEAGYDPREASKVWQKFMDFTGNPSLMTQLEQTADEWLKKTEMYPYPNPMASIGDLIFSKVLNKAMDTWYSSHPKATKRFRNLNQLVATNYVRDDWSGVMIGKEEYGEIQRLVKQ